jgi:putative ABC transport system permease protein
MFLVSVLSVIALVLAAAGIYATVYFAVAQRKSEMGIRLALGARGDEVMMTIIKPVLTLTIFGIVLGMTGVVLLTRYLSSVLFGISPTDGLTLFSVSILMIVVSLIAAYIPARAVLKLDPAEVLRYE